MNAFAKPILALCLLMTNPMLANPTAPDKPTGFQAYVYSTETNKVRVAVEKTIPEALSVSLRQK